MAVALYPGAEVFGAGIPGREVLHCRAFGWLPAVASAFVEVGGQVREDFQPGHLGGGGEGPDDRGVGGGVAVTGTARSSW